MKDRTRHIWQLIIAALAAIIVGKLYIANPTLNIISSSIDPVTCDSLAPQALADPVIYRDRDIVYNTLSRLGLDTTEWFYADLVSEWYRECQVERENRMIAIFIILTFTATTLICLAPQRTAIRPKTQSPTTTKEQSPSTTEGQ